MKNILLVLLFVPLISIAQKTYVPDNNFEQKLIDLGYDDVLDDSVLTSNINTVTSLNIPGIGYIKIKQLTGLEDFTPLDTLICSNNKIDSKIMVINNN